MLIPIKLLILMRYGIITTLIDDLTIKSCHLNIASLNEM